MKTYHAKGILISIIGRQKAADVPRKAYSEEFMVIKKKILREVSWFYRQRLNQYQRKSSVRSWQGVIHCGCATYIQSRNTHHSVFLPLIKEQQPLRFFTRLWSADSGSSGNGLGVSSLYMLSMEPWKIGCGL